MIPAIHFDQIMADEPSSLQEIKSSAPGPSGALPLTDAILRNFSSGDLFGWTQDAGMGLEPRLLGQPEFLILSTSGGSARTTVHRSRSATTPATGKSGCWCGRRRRNSRRSAVCRLPEAAPIPATGARRARPA